MKDYYEILQVSLNAEPEVVAAAYRRLARKYHPDTYGGADATQRMRELNEAYEVLGDPARRAEYDRIRGYARAGVRRAERDAPGAGGRTVDLADDPSYIFDPQLDRTQIQLRGIRLGDPEDKIPKAEVFAIHPGGWHRCRGGARYRVADGRIVEFELGDELLNRTGLLRENEIQMRLGKADHVHIFAAKVKGGAIPFAKVYQFYAKHIEVRVFAHLGKVEVIRIVE